MSSGINFNKQLDNSTKSSLIYIKKEEFFDEINILTKLTFKKNKINFKYFTTNLYQT